MVVLPRLTGALRAFSGLTAPPQSEEPRQDILGRRRKNKAQKLQRGVTWKDLKGALKRHGNKDVNLNNLRSFARELVGSDSTPDVIEETGVFLFRLFLSEHLVLRRHLHILKLMFGTVSENMATKICKEVRHLVAAANLEDSDLEDLREGKKKEAAAKEEFGKNIKFVYPKPFSTEGLDFLLDLTTTKKNGPKDFSLNYDNFVGNSAAAGDKKKNHSRIKKIVQEYNRKWLEQQTKLYYKDELPLGLSISEFLETIMNLLISEQSSESLQNELFNLMGFDRFELIQILLEHRHDIMSSANSPTPQMVPAALTSVRPSYGCQVIVQSEQERLLKKQVQKEEKKMNRALAASGQDGDSLEEQKFVPQDLRAKRKAALIAAMNSPILKARPAAAPRERYPHVYDSHQDAKHTSGYIADMKMMLPLGVDRIDNNIYEEINIPVSGSVPTGLGNNLVPISILDELGQIAFQGMKTLNLIQSVVFDTAFHTNENLLICAPTGAGKTNIAMLAIVREVKQHIDQGVIKKDEFKIVYVAPMKALAAEMTANFGRRLAPLGLQVKELTGDMQLTKSEIRQTQMLVTTPEKWDVMTRKSTGDVGLTQLVKLLIVDEVHLLHGDRGPVVEALVARTLKQVELSQSMIRLVGLSATLPNYIDVAMFLHVNPYVGLFFFDTRFRPVPLSQTFIGVKTSKSLQQMQDMDQICYDKASAMVKEGHQVMIFVNARNATFRVAQVLKEMASHKGEGSVFRPTNNAVLGAAEKAMGRSRNKQLQDLFKYGFGIHHAGMLRTDRNLVEKLFTDGMIKVLVCTATLAWGVNLPAHAVIIRGTEIYDAKRGTFVDLDILDVLQIFGRAGRPQFDKSGSGTIITSHDKLGRYISLLTNQFPIESKFIDCLTDNLNAEISLGTVTNIDEGVDWLSYTYLYLRMKKNPHVYGIKYSEYQNDPMLYQKRYELITVCALQLEKAKMIRFDQKNKYLSSTDLGRTASHYYIKYASVEIFNECLQPVMNDAHILSMLCKAQEFEQLKVREDELEELDHHKNEHCELLAAGGSENQYGKVNILLQTYISKARLSSFSLICDQSYVIQNAGRIARALFEIVLQQRNALMAGRLLKFSKMVELQLWDYEHPLKQFSFLKHEVLQKIDNLNLTVEKLRDLDSREVGHFIRHVNMGSTVKRCAEEFPLLDIESSIQPITRSVLRVRLTVTPDFRWNDKVHGNKAEAFWIWVEEPDTYFMYHHEYFLLSKKQVVKKESQMLVFTIPIHEPLPSQYYVRAVSDRWLGSEICNSISFQHLILPERHPPHTDLLDLNPLPITVLRDKKLEMLYKFTHFNPIQTQMFHCLYHTDNNVLLGAPTGSGKTIAAEIAMFRIFREYEGSKVVYIAPMKALVRERIEDWKVRLQEKLGKNVVELTGDVTPDVRAIASADVIVTTPEKWDGVSRSWQTRNYVQSVALIVIDEIHLLGEDRGPVLEVIVSRTNFISSHTNRNLRIIGLSTALANARDLADWLKIGQMGLYNFKPSVRPVPIEVHVSGFPGKHYCPRMASMNKPAFQAIQQHSPMKPTLVFVSSRRQTRLTALDLIAYLAGQDNPRQWLHMNDREMDQIIAGIRDTNLKLTLSFGIAIHHAGLHERDRKTVEELFVNQKIQVLIATATLAWGVNFPAHLVIIKGTEYYDGKSKRYVDMPITDVLQMMGRAGRPQFDDSGVAVVLVHDIKKDFYKKFLYEPFPVESSLLEVLPDHMNAEIVAGTIQTKQDALDYLTWTYFFRRLIQNPTYYNLEEVNETFLNSFLGSLVERAVMLLEESYCVSISEDNRGLNTTTLGRIASYYYLSHKTVQHFREKIGPASSMGDLLSILSEVEEYDQLPVRHNEEIMNSELAKKCPVPVDAYTYDSPHTKAHLLFQAHFSRIDLPCTDYYTDLKSVLDQAIRILQAMIDVSADQGWLSTTICIQNLMQMVIQGHWLQDSSLLTLPHISHHVLYCFHKVPRNSSQGRACKNGPLESLPELIAACSRSYESLASLLRNELEEGQIEQIYKTLRELPVISVHLSVKGWWDDTTRAVEKPIYVGPRTGQGCKSWVPVHADQEYTLSVQLTRVNHAARGELRVHTPRFPKGKDECWFLVLGHIENKDLMALKRVSGVRGKSLQQLAFVTPQQIGRVIYTLYLISDSYLGLDQQYDICLEVIPSSLKSQVNTELDDVDSLDGSFEQEAASLQESKD